MMRAVFVFLLIVSGPAFSSGGGSGPQIAGPMQHGELSPEELKQFAMDALEEIYAADPAEAENVVHDIINYAEDIKHRRE